VGQANNFYIFPAVGMAIYATQAKRVSDEMFIEAGQTVADQVPNELLNQGMLYPQQSNILENENSDGGARSEVSLRLRTRAGRTAEGHGGLHPPACLQARIREPTSL
jgi:hypothetical protein